MPPLPLLEVLTAFGSGVRGAGYFGRISSVIPHTRVIVCPERCQVDLPPAQLLEGSGEEMPSGVGRIRDSGLYVVILRPIFEAEQSPGTSPISINQLSVLSPLLCSQPCFRRCGRYRSLGHVVSAPGLVAHVEQCMLVTSVAQPREVGAQSWLSLRPPGLGRLHGRWAGAGLGGWVSVSRGRGKREESPGQKSPFSKGEVVGVSSGCSRNMWEPRTPGLSVLGTAGSAGRKVCWRFSGEGPE